MPDHRRVAWKLAAIAIGVAAALCLLEVGLRLTKPYKTHRAAIELRHFRQGGESLAADYVVDSDFGFRPRLGTDKYSEWGTLPNSYPLEKRPGATRILFVGDSATHRGTLVEGFRAVYGDEDFEYWNAGVESFNTRQELEFYRRFNAKLDPDYVVLTFHLNDFYTTPVAFVDDAGALVVYTPHRPRRRVSPFLFRHLHLYRIYLGYSMSRSAARRQRRADVESALIEFRGAVEPEAKFQVVVLPILAPLEQWSEDELEDRQAVLRILERHGIVHADLLPVLESELLSDRPLGDPEGDPWHLSQEFAAAAADWLSQRDWF